MIRCTVDTNVAIVANGPSDSNNSRLPSVACRISAVEFLKKLLENGTLVIDLEGDIQAEYRSRLSPSGQPGVGDRFYQAVLQSAPHLIERVRLAKRDDGQYAALPQSIIDSGFDPSDRKFAALACQENIPVYVCTDSDWVHARVVLAEAGIQVRYLCGEDPEEWFA